MRDIKSLQDHSLGSSLISRTDKKLEYAHTYSHTHIQYIHTHTKFILQSSSGAVSVSAGALDAWWAFPQHVNAATPSLLIWDIASTHYSTSLSHFTQGMRPEWDTASPEACVCVSTCNYILVLPYCTQQFIARIAASHPVDNLEQNKSFSETPIQISQHFSAFFKPFVCAFSATKEAGTQKRLKTKFIHVV